MIKTATFETPARPHLKSLCQRGCFLSNRRSETHATPIR